MTERFRLVSAAHLLLFRDGEVLLLKRQNTGYEDGNYSVPAGHHDAGEPMSATAIRELEEETGVTARPEDVRLGCVMHRVRPSGIESIDYFFIVDRWQGTIENREPDHCAELRYFPIEALPDNTIPYVRAGIEAAHANRYLVEFGWDAIP